MDLVYLKYAVNVNGVTDLALNHLDTIGKMQSVKLCVGYKFRDKIYDEYSDDIIGYENEVEPIYEEYETNYEIGKINSYEELPINAKKYLERIEEYLNVPVSIIGIGPENEDVIIR